MTKKIKAFIGDLDWEDLRAFLVVHLIKCETIEEFKKLLEAIVNSVGTKKQLEKKRKDLNIKPFSKKDKKMLNSLK